MVTARMDLQLRTTLTIGRLTGCFPVKSISSLTFTIRHLIFFFSLIPLILYVGSEVCILIAERTEIASAPMSKVVMQYLIAVNDCISCGALRLWNLWACGSLAALISQTIQLKSDATCKKGSYIIRYYVLGYLILLINIVPSGVLISKFLFNTTDEGDIKHFSFNFGFLQLSSWAGVAIFLISHLIFALAVYFAMAITVSIGVDLLYTYENFCYNLQKLYCIEAVSNVHIIHDDDEQDMESDEDERVEVDGGADKIPSSFQEIWSTSGSLKDPESVIAKAQQDAIRPAKEELWAKASVVQRLQHTIGVMSMKELSENFLVIQKSFDEYSRTAGPMLFVLISHATISLIHKLFAIASSEFSNLTDTHDLIQFSCHSIVAFLTIASLAHLGEIIIVKMRKWKEQLKCIMLTELLCEKYHDSTNTLTESVVKWDWELNAMSLFSINHALLPAIAGTMVTYLIVIIQLKVSEAAETLTPFLASQVTQPSA